MTDLFTNKTLIQAPPVQVLQMIADPDGLVYWNPAIEAVTPQSAHQYQIYRRTDAINSEEYITITVDKARVTFSAVGDGLDYVLVFTLQAQAAATIVVESLTIIAQHGLALPLNLIKPLMKQAFKANLASLRAYVERSAAL